MEKIKKFATKRNLDILFILVAIAMGVYLKWQYMEVIIFAVFIYIILRPVSSRLLAFPALIFLGLTPFFLIFKKEKLAESLAVYAYYFLIMTVIMAIYELRKEEKQVTRHVARERQCQATSDKNSDKTRRSRTTCQATRGSMK